MQRNKKKTFMRQRRHRRIRSRVSGTVARPRLAVFRSSKQIYVQGEISTLQLEAGLNSHRRPIRKRRLEA